MVDEVVKAQNMTISPEDVALIRQCARDDAAYQQLVALFDRQVASSDRLHRYQHMVYSAEDGMALVNRDYVYEIVNDLYMECTNLERHEVEGRPVAEILGEAFFNDVIKPRLDRCLAGETVRYTEWFDCLASGRRYSMVTYSPCRDEAGRIIGVVVNSQNVIELKRTQDALRASQDALHRLIQQIPVGIQVFNTDGLCTEINQAHAEIFGVGRDALVGHYNILTNTLPHEIEMQIRDAAFRALKGETVALGDLLFDFKATDPRFADNRQKNRIINVTLVPILDENYRVTSFVGVNMDVTQRHEAQQRNLELTLEKERRIMLSSFIQNAAHEFRTPLTTITMSAHLMSRFDDSERRHSKAQQISYQVEQITRLLDMLLLLVRLENNPTAAQKPLQLDTLLAGLCQTWQEICGDRCEIRTDLPPHLPQIKGNMEQLSIAFRQLLDNACRFSPTGTQISVMMEVINGRIMVQIQDAGPGIPTEALPHIFKTFWRLDAAHTTTGFGLGLPIAQKIIEQHKGIIEVSSQAGQGTCFTVILPIVQG